MKILSIEVEMSGEEYCKLWNATCDEVDNVIDIEVGGVACAMHCETCVFKERRIMI